MVAIVRQTCEKYASPVPPFRASAEVEASTEFHPLQVFWSVVVTSFVALLAIVPENLARN